MPEYILKFKTADSYGTPKRHGNMDASLDQGYMVTRKGTYTSREIVNTSMRVQKFLRSSLNLLRGV
jgi:hypothetical protein